MLPDERDTLADMLATARRGGDGARKPKNQRRNNGNQGTQT